MGYWLGKDWWDYRFQIFDDYSYMKIDQCLVSCDSHPLYVDLWPLVKRMWKEICGIKVVLVLIADEIPEGMDKEDVVLFRPIEGMHTAYQAQVIRLLYPCLLEGVTIISDMDILPMRKEYFIDSVDGVPDDHLVVYRDAYFWQGQIGMCYNAASQEVWKELFGIESVDDVIKILKEWYHPEYDGKKQCPGWYTDQEKLYQRVHEWGLDRVTIFKDKEMEFKRLDKKQKQYICKLTDEMMDGIKNRKYVDFHMIRPHHKYKRVINRIVKQAEESHM